MLVGIFPGSFNPFHEGHADILDKAFGMFDKIIVAVGVNPDKEPIEGKYEEEHRAAAIKQKLHAYGNKVRVIAFTGLLVDLIDAEEDIHAIIRGLRNGTDLEYEKTQQYWNEDLGIVIPVVYYITDRKILHISSSAKRTLVRYAKYE